jgi:cytochrome c2
VVFPQAEHARLAGTIALALLKKGNALPNADREAVIKTLVGITKEKGDAAGGKTVFTNICAKCHTHTGIGYRFSPQA